MVDLVKVLEYLMRTDFNRKCTMSEKFFGNGIGIVIVYGNERILRDSD